MKSVYPFLLVALLFCLTGASVTSAERAESAAVVHLGCDVTIRGSHGGASGSIELQLGESDVRNRVGWWKTIHGGIITLETRESFSEVVRLDFGCNARRRYRFFFEANVDGTRYQYMHYFPNENDFTQQTLIDLGDVSRFFDAIEPAPDLPSTEPLAGIELDGQWIRRESNNHPNDGMQINLSGQTATLTFVPQAASSDWQVGDVLWQGISEAGQIEVRGSNGGYFAAQLTANGLNQLAVAVEHGGAGNDQTWVRGQRVLSGEGGPDISDEDEVEIAEACADQLQLDPAVAAIVDPIVENLMVEQEIVGMAVGIIQSGDITHLMGYGYADRENETPATWETKYRWASVSKTLTAVAALSLWEDGDFLLHEDIRTDVPEYPEKPEGTITAFMTLSNTSGIRQYDSLRAVSHPYATRAANFSRDLPYDPIAAVNIFGDASLINPTMSPPFSPGRRYHYSTFGFILAGAAVERAAEDALDQTYTELIQDRIAEPLCMDSLSPDEPGQQSELETRRYRKDRNGIIYRLDDDDRSDDENILWKLPGGGYQSNIRDLALFARGLMEREIVEETTHLLQETVVMGSYGLGIYIEGFDHDMDNATPEIRRIGHGGDAGGAGVRASMFFYPDQDLGIVLLINSSQAARGRILNSLANALGAPWGNAAYNLTSYLRCDSTTQTQSDSRFAAIWRDGPTGQLLRRGYSLGKFAEERDRLRSLDYHLTDLETFEHEGERLWDGVFTPGAEQTRIWRNFELEPFLQKVTDQRADDYRLVDVEVYVGSQGQHLWAGVFAPAEELHVLEPGLNTAEFHDVWESRTSDGFRLVDIETYEATNGMRLWAGVFAEGSGGSGLFRNVPPEDFAARRNDLRQDGLRLIDVETYLGSQGEPLWALVGRPFDGNVESRINKTFCGTWNGRFTGLWETHEDQARQGRSLVDFERYPAPVD